MTTREPIDWKVPKREWERFEEFVHREIGDHTGSIGQTVEKAMREYAEIDQYSPVEKRLRQFMPPNNKKTTEQSEIRLDDKSSVSSLANTERQRIQVCVLPEISTAFRNQAQNADDTYGVELGRALRQYRTNPRHKRLEELVNNISEIDFGSASESSRTTDVDSTGTVSSKVKENSRENVEESSRRKKQTERTVDRIINELEEEHGCHRHRFQESELETAIKAHTGEGERPPSQPTIRKYRDEVTSKLEVAKHPLKESLWMPREEIQDRPEGVPWECWVSLDHLDRDREGKARRIKLILGTQAVLSKKQKISITPDELHDKLLEEQFSTGTVRNTIKEINKGSDAFRWTKSVGGTRILNLDLEKLKRDEPDLFQGILDYKNAITDPDNDAEFLYKDEGVGR